MGARQGGVVLRHRGDQGDVRAFVGVASIESLAPMPKTTPVVGAALPLVGVAAVAGGLVPVLDLGSEARRRSTRPPAVDRGNAAPRPLVICLHEGERVGLSGAEVLAVGHFDEAGAGGAVLFEGEAVEWLDLGALVAHLRAKPWAGRVRG
jgi:hypothetical protein